MPQSAPDQPDFRPRITAGLTARRIAKTLLSELFRVPTDISGVDREDDLLNTLLLWPPDLFAFTSTVMSVTGAYQLVVSPPYMQGNSALRDAQKVLEPLGEYASLSRVKDLFSWPPKVDVATCLELAGERKLEGDARAAHLRDNFLARLLRHAAHQHEDYSWAKRVREIGYEWRQQLELHFSSDIISEFKQANKEDASPKSTTMRLEQLDKLCEGPESWVPGRLLDIFDVLKSWVNSSGEEYSNLSYGISDLYTIFDINCMESDADEQYAKEFEHANQRNVPEEAALAHANRLAANWVAFQSLITLHAIADEACVGLGTRRRSWTFTCKNPDKQPPLPCKHRLEDPRQYDSEVLNFAERRLKRFGTLSNVHTQICRVLPKRHTPELGITLRSLSSSVSYHRSSIDVKWSQNNHQGGVPEDQTSNELMSKLVNHDHRSPISLAVLLLPWPMEIKMNDFRPANQQGKKSVMNNKDKTFSYVPPEENVEELRRRLKAALESARKEAGGKPVDVVILPECALDDKNISDFEKICGDEKVSMYIAGVYRDARDEFDLPDNMVYFKMGKLGKVGHEKEKSLKYPGEVSADNEHKKHFYQKPENYYTQYKHHHWKLDHAQVFNYGLGYALPSTLDWWEAIKIRRRRVTFINVGEELTICPLICEDLARQDPIADLLRTVGPSLVVTVLMDGPQRKDRWSSRYATVLAEDPGCAVLTLTSYGMVRRWKPPYIDRTPAPVVALWNDGQGNVQEIELGPNSEGVLLSLTLGSKYESTLDGRKAFYRTSTLKLGGVYQVLKTT